ncbi:hypothetical protein Sste5344_007290 [Sporothrix stenoceras]
MANDNSRQGSIDLNADPTALGSLHVKTLKEAARLGNYLPIRWEELAKIPFWGGVFGYNSDWYRAAISMSVLGMRKRADRALSQDEAQAVAGMTAKLTRTMAFEPPIAMATALFFERRSRSTFGFPFYTPREGFNPNVFPTQNRPIIMGQYARPAWHILRYSLYAAVWHFALRAVFLSYGTSINSVALETDPRMADLRDTLKKQTRGSQVSSKKNSLKEMADELKDINAKLEEAGKAMREDLERYRREGGGGGAPRGPVESSRQQPRQYPQQVQQQQAQPQQQQQQQRTPQSQPQQQWSQPPPQQQQQTQASSYDDYSNDLGEDFYDDASPTSREEQRRQAWEQRKPTSGTGESTAWDRLRHPGHSGEKPSAISQAPPGQYGWEALRKGKSPPPRPTTEQQDDSNKPTTGDYTFNEADEEKQLARNQAQKDFDAMLERERQGESDKPSRRW